MKNISLEMKTMGLNLYGLEIYAQPIVNISSNYSLPHFEILSRFQDHRGNDVIPDLVFDKDRPISQLKSLDLIVFEESFKVLSQNKAQLGDKYTAKINASHASIHDNKEFLDSLSKLATQYGINPRNVTIEINENSDKNINKFTPRAYFKGFGVSVDDFGTSKSGVLKVLDDVIANTAERYFKKLSIKIDKSCTQKLDMQEKYHKIFERLIGIATALKQIHPKITIVAEGVEKDSQLHYLQREDIDFGQGYFWSKPIPFQEYISQLNQFKNSNQPL